VVFIEGTAGSGKTHVLDLLEKRGYLVVRQGTDYNKSHVRVLADKYRWMCYRICTTAAVHNRELVAATNARAKKNIVFVEGSYASNDMNTKTATLNRHMTGEESKVCIDLSDSYKPNLKWVTSVAVYLRCPVKVCTERLEECEPHYTHDESHISGMHDRLEAMYGGKTPPLQQTTCIDTSDGLWKTYVQYILGDVLQGGNTAAL
jgi:thymidylate kinase